MRIVCLLAIAVSMSVGAQEAPNARCDESAQYAALDFWVGDWDVYVGTDRVGKNTIEKIMQGCAVLEHWQSAEGDLGTSLFYVDSQGSWKQVWVTEFATMPGGVKEKIWQSTDNPREVRFQGRVHTQNGKSYLDRTTLTKLSRGRVRQLIEVSTDGGAAWRTIFDAEYRPRL